MDKITDEVNGYFRPELKFNYKSNTFLLMTHVLFAPMYWYYHFDILFYYNFISIFVFTYLYLPLKRQEQKKYLIIVFSEIFVYTILNIALLGWEYGYQIYCLGFIICLLLCNFYMGKGLRVNRSVKVIIAADTIVFFAFRIYFYFNEPLYHAKEPYVAKTFYVCNSLVSFILIIAVTAKFISIVYDLESKLLNSASTDALTGLPNRRKMYMVVDDERSKISSDEFVALAMMDIDHFKVVNDTYGHKAGDEVLKDLAMKLEKIAKENPAFQVFRWGGEEFVMIYTGKSLNRNESEIFFKDLQEKISNNDVEYKGKKIAYTITMGVTFYEGKIELDKMVSASDELMYVGKEHGRNCVVFEN